MHPALDNVVICASAGSGKTYQLAQRYIRLLRQGVEPERICALTFTRKAAGEMFDKIVDALLKARQEAEAQGNESEVHAFTLMLRRLLLAIPRLQIATLDSFASGMARAFAFELGLPASITLMDSESPEGRQERAKLLARLSDSRFVSPRARGHLVNALTLASFGKASKKSINARLDAFIREHGQNLRASARHWGDLARAFPEGLPEAIPNPARREALLTAALEGLRADAPAIADGLTALLTNCAAFTPEHSLPDFKNTLPQQLIGILAEARTELVYRKKPYPLTPPTLAAIRALLGHVAATDLERQANQTRGIAEALEPYLELESAHIIQTGRMTFDDLTRLLSLAEATFTSAYPTLLEKRIYINFRMDSRIDHYMLDEFQDTSDRQWKLLEPLISEVIMPPPRDRSFFYVGDVKQCIYAWRGGNYHLFGDVHNRFRSELTEIQLSKSYRSAPPVIETINRIFTLKNLSKETRAALPKATLDFWETQWEPHTAAITAKPGVAELITHPAKDPALDNDPAADTIVDIIHHLQSQGKKQVDIAILVRGNAEGATLAEAIKRQGIPVAVEGRRNILDSPPVHLACSYLRAITHPGDTAAWGHLLMSPLGTIYAPACGTPTEPGTQALRSAFALNGLRRIQKEGFQALLTQDLLPLLCPGTFTPHDHRRWSDLMRIARQFDTAGDTDTDSLIRAIEGHTIQDAPAAGTIRIMTIHQSKGLTFDATIIPFTDTGSRTLSNPEQDPLLTGDDWALLRPKADTCKLIPAIAKIEEPTRADKAYEALAVLYVALTRAANALYIITPPPPQKATAIRPTTLLRETLAGPAIDSYPSGGEIHYRQGNPNWFTTLPPIQPAPLILPFDPTTLTLPQGQPPPKRYEPSAAAPHTPTIAQLLDPTQLAIRDFGTAIHRLFSRIRWLTDTDLEAQINTWKTTAPEAPEIIRDAETQFRSAITQPQIREALTPPATPCDLWLEAPFTARLSPREYIGGRFDRVVIHRSHSGTPIGADIYDYKSSLIDTPAQAHRIAENYRPQMHHYRRALSRLLNLPPTTIATHLLFTRTGHRITLTLEN